jgi:hypothetical protein
VFLPINQNNEALFASSKRSKRSKLGLFAMRSNRPRRFLTDRAAPPVFKRSNSRCLAASLSVEALFLSWAAYRGVTISPVAISDC